MNEELRLRGEPVEFRGEPVEEMPQCLEEIPVCKTPIEPYESKEQIADRRNLDILKHWEIGIHVLDRGCIVKIGCKSIAFVSIEAGYKEIGRYLENPQLVATQHGFGDHL
ncbi:MAG TPA: hypothetical protein DEB23_01090 [Chitinophagaceae bacterium]|nr:hypothetical protein [Chitinophagaceae bacterium]